jgi:hypothetical protein
MQYAVGGEYKIEGSLEWCKRGFHFCGTVAQVHLYYNLADSRICEVEATGFVISGKGKYVTNRIKILRELSRKEIWQMVNSGENNSGYQNSGDLNSGDRNSGDRNSGDQNSGDRNSGNFCSCDGSSGVFMSRRLHYEAFNKTLSQNEYNKLVSSSGYKVCLRFHPVQFRMRAVTGKYGDYRYMSYKASWRVFWNGLSFQERLAVARMPHFDAKVFYEITGIKVFGKGAEGDGK